MSAPAVDTTIRVRYAETDAQGVVYHANYVVYFEVGRGAFLRDRGVDYNALEAAGTFVVVAEASARYLAPARYDDELVVTTRCDELRNTSFTCGYEVRKGDAIVCTGKTVHVCIGREGRPVRVPELLRAALAGADEG
jgi:acyl-CoA thioester hydrolase